MLVLAPMVNELNVTQSQYTILISVQHTRQLLYMVATVRARATMSARDQCCCGTWHQQTDVTHIGSHSDDGSDGTGSRVVRVLHVAITTGKRDL